MDVCFNLKSFQSRLELKSRVVFLTPKFVSVFQGHLKLGLEPRHRWLFTRQQPIVIEGRVDPLFTAITLPIEHQIFQSF
jgi:hypothetical protein